MNGKELSQQSETTQPTPRVSPRRPIYFLAFAGAALLDVILLDLALGFERRSAAYQWLNRVGILLGLILTFGFFSWGLWMSFRQDWDGGPISRWVARAFSLIVPLVFVFKMWPRFPDALWLR